MFRIFIYLFMLFFVVTTLSEINVPERPVEQHLGFIFDARFLYRSDDYGQNWRLEKTYDSVVGSRTWCYFTNELYSNFTSWGENLSFAVAVRPLPPDLRFSILGYRLPKMLYTGARGTLSMFETGGACVVGYDGRIFIRLGNAMLVGSNSPGNNVFTHLYEWRTWNLYPIEGKPLPPRIEPPFRYKLSWMLSNPYFPISIFLQILVMVQILRLPFQPGERFAHLGLAFLAGSLTTLSVIGLSVGFAQTNMAFSVSPLFLLICASVLVNAGIANWICHRRHFSRAFRFRVVLASGLAGLLVPLIAAQENRAWFVAGICLYNYLFVRRSFIQYQENQGYVTDELQLVSAMKGLIRSLMEISLFVLLLYLDWRVSLTTYVLATPIAYVFAVYVFIISRINRHWAYRLERSEIDSRKKKKNDVPNLPEISLRRFLRGQWLQWLIGMAATFGVLLMVDSIANAIVGVPNGLITQLLVAGLAK